MGYVQALLSEDPEFWGMVTLILVSASWLAFIALVSKERKKEDDKNG